MSNYKEKDPWKKGYASDSSSSSAEDDEAPSGYRRAALNADRRLAADLDLSSRYETVKFTSTPFNLAQINAAHSAQRSNPDCNANRQASQGQAPASSSTVARLSTQSDNSAWKVVNGRVGVKSSPSEPRRQAGKSIPIANPDPGGRNDVRLLEQQKEEEKREQERKKKEDKAKKKDWTKYSGWTERGQPVPITKVRRSLTEVVDEQEAAAAKANKRGGGAKRRRKDDEGDDDEVDYGAEGTRCAASKKVPVKKGKAKAKAPATKNRGKKKEDDKITFGRIPADAGLSDRFPIVQALAKQRDLPPKSRSKKQPAAARSRLTFRSALSDSESDDRVDLDRLFEGIAQDTHRQSLIEGRQAGIEPSPLPEYKGKDMQATAEAIEPDSPSAHASPDPVPKAAQAARISPQQKEAEIDGVEDLDSEIGDFGSDEDEDGGGEQGDVPAEVRQQNRNLAELRARLVRENAEIRRKRIVEPRDQSPPSAQPGLGRYHAVYALGGVDGRRDQAPTAKRGPTTSRPNHSWEDDHWTRHGPRNITPEGLEGVDQGAFATLVQHSANGSIVSDLGPDQGQNHAQVPRYSSDDCAPPSTITRVSLPRTSEYFGPPSSSSQLPYSSPLERHTREMPANEDLATPAPRRLPAYGLETIQHLEGMAQATRGPHNTAHIPGMIAYEEGWHPVEQGAGPVQHLEHMADTLDAYFDYRQPTILRPQTNPPYYPPASGGHALAAVFDGSDSYITMPASRKRASSPEGPRHTKIKPIKRTRAERRPLHQDATGGQSTANEWSTLGPRSKKKHSSPDYTRTPNFRLPSNFFALQQNRQPGLSNPRSSASSASARAGWFKPSDPGAATKTPRIKDDYSIVTSRGVQPGRQKEQESKSRPTFVTRARREDGLIDAQDGAHAQLRDAVGIQGQTRTALRDLQVGSRDMGHDGERAGAEGDWRDAWRNGGKGVTEKGNTQAASSAFQNKFTYAGPRQSRAASVANGRAFEF